MSDVGAVADVSRAQTSADGLTARVQYSQVATIQSQRQQEKQL